MKLHPNPTNSKMRTKKPENALRGKLNLTMHPEVREWADIIAFKRRRSISQLFEDLVEAEWHRQKQPQPSPAPIPPAAPQYGQPTYMPLQPLGFYPSPQAPMVPPLSHGTQPGQ